MQVSNPNNVKIYNLSAGKSLPQWLSDRRKRTLQKNDVDIRKRIELIQDFEMPMVSNNIQVTKDKQYILASGVYKPRIRCYDINHLSMKFERCFDSEIVKFHVLSEDYTKLVFLQADRFIEFHAQHGKYYRTRIPKFGRDLAFHKSTSDLYFVGASPEIFRLNLEQGRFMSSLKTNAVEINCCEFNSHHDLFTCGTSEGHVECWDPRVRNRVAVLDCALGTIVEDTSLDTVPGITSLKYRDALNLAVGTSTGQILLYDIRSNKPLLVKDHNYGLPIKDIEFNEGQNLVMSLDSRILKLWDRETGKAFTSIEPGTDLNDLCVVPDTGMLFMTNEAPKILSYYIPTLGPAPKWASFLDSLTEELEENYTPMIYDDYKFVTRTELDGLGLTHLIGSNLLRAYMHGYFMDIRLYHKAKNFADPFAYEDYRKSKVRQKIEESRKNRVVVKQLPKVNRQLAEKLTEEEQDPSIKKKKKETLGLLKDGRFSTMFSNPDFQVDTESEDYRLLNPLVSKLDKERMARKERESLKQQFEEIEGEERKSSSEDDSSDDEHTWTGEMKKQHKLLQDEAWNKRREEWEERKMKFYEIKQGSQVLKMNDPALKKKTKTLKKSLGERLQEQDDGGMIKTSGSSVGAMEMTFKTKKNKFESKQRQEALQHHSERRKIRRSASEITRKQKPGKRT